MHEDSMNRIEELLKTPYWIIDILPKRVPKDSMGQYFHTAAYFLRHRMEEIKSRHISLILKLNCYYDIEIQDKVNPDPEEIDRIMREKYVYIMVGDSMILSEKDDTHMTVFHPDEELLDLIRTLASSEGLFVWNGAEN